MSPIICQASRLRTRSEIAQCLKIPTQASSTRETPLFAVIARSFSHRNQHHHILCIGHKQTHFWFSHTHTLTCTLTHTHTSAAQSADASWIHSDVQAKPLHQRMALHFRGVLISFKGQVVLFRATQCKSWVIKTRPCSMTLQLWRCLNSTC